MKIILYNQSCDSTYRFAEEVQRHKPFDHVVNPTKGCLIAEGFRLLHFPLDESYVRVQVFTRSTDI